jgi:hypothetical protein
MTKPITPKVFADLRRAAATYRKTLAAHQQNPRDASALEAWDKATNEFMGLINNDEINIIAALLDALEAKDKCIAELQSRAESAEQALLLERQKGDAPATLPKGCEHDVIAPVAAFMYEEGFDFDTEDYNALTVRVRSELETVLRRTLRAAGITLQIKGE